MLPYTHRKPVQNILFYLLNVHCYSGIRFQNIVLVVYIDQAHISVQQPPTQVILNLSPVSQYQFTPRQ